MKIGFRFLPCLFLAAAAFTALQAHGLAEEAVRIGVCLSLSGENSETGRRSMAGVQMRADEWNRQGGSPRVELVIRDDQGDPDTTRKVIAELVEVERVPAIIGPDSPQLLFAVRDYLTVHRVVAVSPNVTSAEISKNDGWTFRLMFDDHFQSQALARFLFGSLEMRRAAAILNTHYPYPEAVFAPFAENFEQMGGTIATVERFDWRYDEENSYDFTDLLNALRDADPEFVFIPLHAPEVAEVIRDSLGTDLDTTFCGADTWENEELLMAAGNNLNDSYYVSGLNIFANTEEMQRFLELLDNSNDIHAEPSSVYGYDALSMLLEAIQDGPDPRRIRNNLYSLRNFPLATGPITIDRALGTMRPVYIHKITKENNEFKPTFINTIWPYGMQQR